MERWTYGGAYDSVRGSSMNVDLRGAFWTPRATILGTVPKMWAIDSTQLMWSSAGDELMWPPRFS